MEENNVVSVLTMPVLLAGTALLFAIVIERALEVIKSIYDYCDYFYKWSEQWNKRAEKVRDRLELRLDEAAKQGRQMLM